MTTTLKKPLLTCSGVTGAGQSEKSFLLEYDAPTNQEGREQGEHQAEPEVVGIVCLSIWRQRFSVCS